MAEIGTDVEQAAKVLSTGGLVGIPTETVYGLAANAFDEKAVVNIFTAKNRPSFDPLITHIANKKALAQLALSIPQAATVLMEAFWPGPLTLVLPKSDKISDVISSGLDTAAFRVPRHQVLQELLERLDFPVVAPSANPFGYVSPTSATHVNNQLGDKIDYILDGGACKIGLESTIVGFNDDIPVILRLGGLSVEEIESVVGAVIVKTNSTSKPSAPGMLSAHYSPKKKVITGKIEVLLKTFADKKIGILSFTKNYPDYPNFVLSEQGAMEEAAINLFAGLRWFENKDIELILTEKVEEKGLGRAINDRLRRASFN